MFGAELTELITFTKQLGLALAGAASLWGLVFSIKCRHESGGEKCAIFEWIAGRLLAPLFVGVIIALTSWLLLSILTPVHAHEGISFVPPVTQVLQASSFTSTIFIIWLFFSMTSLLLKIGKPKFFYRHLKLFYVLQLGFAAFLISFPVWTGSFSQSQFFFLGHSLHSILTLGTVLVLDFLFLTSRSSVILRQHIFPFFPIISKVIWIGLGVDFLSVALVFPEALSLTPKFFFAQTIIGLIIINGVLLSGPITRKIVNSIKEGGEKLTKKWLRIADVAGTVSVSSWFIITLVDSFNNLTFRYYHFLIFFVAFFAMLFSAHLVWNYIEKRKPVHI